MAELTGEGGTLHVVKEDGSLVEVAKVKSWSMDMCNTTSKDFTAVSTRPANSLHWRTRPSRKASNPLVRFARTLKGK